jgi:signal transduction histidine kinase
MDRAASPGFLHFSGPTFERQISIPRGGTSDAVERFRGRSLAGSLGLLVAGLLAAALFAHRATAPLRDLADAARSVGEGALGTQVEARSGGEIGEAIGAFNRMSGRLAELDAQARSLSEREHLFEIGEIARGLAHGLRNPLNALGLSLEELAGTANSDPAGRLELAASARRQIQRIDGSIRSFLALAASDGAAATASIDVLALVQDVALEALHDARGRVSIAVDPASGTPSVHGVPAELRAVVQALVVNAVEASPDEGRVVVRVIARPEAGARIEIDDDGPGLPESVRARLFTPHVTTKASGAGMGLYLAHRILTTRQGGRLELESRLPHGTRAVILLDGTRREDRG